MADPEITCATLIGHDLGLLRWNVENARARANAPHQWLVVNWIQPDAPEPAEAIRKWCQSEGVKYVPYLGTAKPEVNTTPWFLKNLYHGFNMAFSEAETKWVVRMGSDQFFNHHWLANLMRAVDRFGERGIYHCWTVESPLARNSRHAQRAWGTQWSEFDVHSFDSYADELAHRYGGEKALRATNCDLYFRHPARGLQLRPDGCSWLQTRVLWEEFGPMEDSINVEGVTGDVAYMDRLYDGGVRGFLVPPSVTYHLVRSESRLIQT